jgi:hypothetical protein
MTTAQVGYTPVYLGGSARCRRFSALARALVAPSEGGPYVLPAAAMHLARLARRLADAPRARTRRAPWLRLPQAAGGGWQKHAPPVSHAATHPSCSTFLLHVSRTMP